jgi:hypothetical protein
MNGYITENSLFHTELRELIQEFVLSMKKMTNKIRDYSETLMPMKSLLLLSDSKIWMKLRVQVHISGYLRKPTFS